MEIEREDVLNISLVILGVQLLNKSEAKNEFAKQVGTEVTDTPTAGVTGMITINLTPAIGETPPPISPPPPPFQKMRLNRDRIQLDLLPDRANILKEYPKREEIYRFAEVVGIALDQTDFSSQHPQAYGVNLDAVYRLTTGETASQFIVSQLYTPNLFQEKGYQVLGGTSELSLRREERSWNIRFQPRFGDTEADKLFVGLNLHNDDGLVPTQAIMAELLIEVWDQMDSIMEYLS